MAESASAKTWKTLTESSSATAEAGGERSCGLKGCEWRRTRSSENSKYRSGGRPERTTLPNRFRTPMRAPGRPDGK